MENDLYHFLRGYNMHKIKKNTIMQYYKYGGLKMINYLAFIIALKIQLDEKVNFFILKNG